MSLSPTDGFVLSRIDGALTEHDLVAATGLPVEMVAASLATLERLGLITYANGQPAHAPSGPAPASPSGHAPPRTSSGTRAAVAPAPVPSPERSSPALGPEDQTAMAEQVDLDDDAKRAVLSMHGRLEKLDHYTLLDTDRAADRKGIKRAYYELAGKFHPDKYFRKNLGSFKPKMEVIFARITHAHDVLSDRDKRAEYDAYLAERRHLLSAEELVAEALDEVRRVERDVERQVRAEGLTPSPAGGMPAVVVSTLPPAATAQVPAAVPIPNVDVALSARRDALARRLLGVRASSSNPPRDPSAPPSIAAPPGPPSAADAMEALRRRYEDRVARAKAAEARKYLATAKTAEQAGDTLAAANAYRVAAQLAPADVEVARNASEAQAKADSVLAETYAKQAHYEEREQQWTEASRSWLRVCKARPSDAVCHERAAHALTLSNGDKHEAARCAKRACELAPASAPFRLTLAKVYLAAGLTLNARRELETAAQLAPQDDTIRSMLKKL